MISSRTDGSAKGNPHLPDLLDNHLMSEASVMLFGIDDKHLNLYLCNLFKISTPTLPGTKGLFVVLPRKATLCYR